MSSNANWYVHDMGTRFGIWLIWTLWRQDEVFWKHGQKGVSASRSTVWSAKFLPDVYTEENSCIKLRVLLDTATPCLKPCAAIINFIRARKLVFLSMGRKLRETIKRECETNYENNTYKKKVFALLRCTSVVGGTCSRQSLFKQHLRKSSPHRMPLRAERILGNIISEWLLGYVQCDIELPENLWELFANFSHIFKINHFGRDDIGPFMNEYAEKERLLTQPRRMLIPSHISENGTIN